MSLQLLHEAYRDVQDAQIAQVAVAQSAHTSAQSIQLVALPPFAMGHDFEVFVAQLLNYVENVAFPLQMQMLK